MISKGIVREYLGSDRIAKSDFDDLVLVAETCGNNKRIFNWFRFLQNIEIAGWRPKQVTREIVRILNGDKILFYALFCPSYNKTPGEVGVRIDGVGQTTISGLRNLEQIYKKSIEFGFDCEEPKAIFFDLALERAEEMIARNRLKGIQKNIINFKNCIPSGVKFVKLSELLEKKIATKIGIKGIISDELPIPEGTFKRIINRGKKFYERFGWSDNQVVARSKIIACTEALVGSYLKENIPNGIMIYTPTMLERAEVYSGFKFSTDPLAIIFPKKD